MTSCRQRVSFSFSAVAKLAVPPGKWFCLARTGLGYSKYSCCVCGLHHDIFMKHWYHSRSHSDDWLVRMGGAIERTLIELNYDQESAENVSIVRDRIINFLMDKENYFVNEAFMHVVTDRQWMGKIGILTEGPPCLVEMVIPSFPKSSVLCHKSSKPRDVHPFSSIHVGTDERDIRHVPQTKFLISRKKIENLPSNVQVFPRLTAELMMKILEDS